jgi:outer membrane protein assembly factor BamB
VGSHDGSLYCVEGNGTLRWSFDTQGKINHAVARTFNGSIFLGSGDGSLYALNDAGTERWAYNTYSAPTATSSIARDGTIYFGTDQGVFVALLPDGTEKWNRTVGTVGDDGSGGIAGTTAAAVAGDGTIYVADVAGNLMAIRSDGSMLWTKSYAGQVPRAPAVTFDGRVYFPVGSRIIAIGTEEDTTWAEGEVECLAFYMALAVAMVAIVILWRRAQRPDPDD